MAAKSKASRGEVVTPKMRLRRAAEVRGQIQASQLINRLQGHADGTVDLAPTQVKACEILLRKILPDLQVTDLHHHDESEQLTEAQMLDKLEAMLAAADTGTREALARVAKMP